MSGTNYPIAKRAKKTHLPSNREAFQCSTVWCIRDIHSLNQRGMSLNCGLGSVISHMVIDLDETRLQTISQLQSLFAGTAEDQFRVPDKGVVLRYLIATCERIGQAQLLPVFKDLIDQFPFEILEFQSDNGSEYISKRVATLLEKMRVEQTKSRSRHCDDNDLAESKNGSVVRKAFG